MCLGEQREYSYFRGKLECFPGGECRQRLNKIQEWTQACTSESGLYPGVRVINF